MQKEERLYYLILFILSFTTILLAVPVILMIIFPSAKGNLLYLRLMAGYPISLMIIQIIMKKTRGYGLEKITGKIDKKLFVCIFLTLIFVSLIFSIRERGIERNDASFHRILLSTLISVLFIPMQCYSEELIFRIIPQKMMSNGFSSRIWEKAAISVISSLFFALLHLPNSEAQLFNSQAVSFMYYFISALFLCLISLMEKGYTAPIAYHTANNLFIAVIISRKDAATIPSEPFFFFCGNFESLNSIISLAWAMLITIAIILIYKKRQKRRAGYGKKEEWKEETDT